MAAMNDTKANFGISLRLSLLKERCKGIEQRFFWHDERSIKEIRNAKCAGRLQGESLRKLFMFMLQKAAKARFAHAFVISWDTKVRESKTCGRQRKTTEIPSNICSRKLAKAYLKHFSCESYVARGESVAKARA